MSATLFHGLPLLDRVSVLMKRFPSDLEAAEESSDVNEQEYTEFIASRSSLNPPADRPDHHRALLMNVPMVEVDRQQCATLES